MELGRYIDGRALTYDESTGAFKIGDAPVTISQVLQYDAFGQLQWASAEIGAWARGLPPVPSEPPLPAASRPSQTPAAAQPPPFPTRHAAAAAKPRRSTGAIIGIVAGALVGALALSVAGFFAYRAFSPQEPAITTVTSTSLPTPATAPAPTTPAAEPVPAPAATADPGEYVVVTKAQAKDVVTEFLTLRAANDIAGSKALCTPQLLAGPDADPVNDKYWNPDSFEITKLTPDQMYVHVTSMGMWPSGREATIFSVYREPESGQVLIDGFLDPADFPELVTP